MSRSTRSAPRGRMWATVGPAAIVKVIVMGVTGLLAIFTNRLIIGHFGTDAYALYGLIATLPTLLPFADLGMAAVVLNIVGGSTEPKSDPQVRRAIVTAIRILICSGLVIVAAGLVITLTQAWPLVLGAERSLAGAEIVPFLCLAIYGLALPMSIGPRVLVGMGRTTTQIASTGITGPVIFTSVLALTLIGPASAGSYLAIITYVASALVLVLALALAARAIRPQIGAAFREVPFPRRYPGVRAIHIAGPMLIQMLVLPMAMQTDRLLLSHLTHGDELAQYNLASQLFGILLQTIAAAGVALWPIFAKARTTEELVSPMRPTLVFTALGLGAAGLLAVLTPWLVGFISHGRLVLDAWLIGGFIAFVTVEAAKYPAGMYMTDDKGLRFQILPILILVPLNIAISLLLTPRIGAGGPIVGSAVSVLLCQVIPYLGYVRRDLARRRAAGEDLEPEVDFSE